MKWLVLLVSFIPSVAFAALTGVDDQNPNVPVATRLKLDDAIISYYKAPSNLKVEAVLDIINDSTILRHRLAWEPIIGFLTVVFHDDKEHVMGWLSRNNYNNYAQDVIVSALLHAKLKESALIFAHAEQWKDKDISRLQLSDDEVDLKHLPILLPGHIDTLWGAFFASGDPTYVNEIIDVLFRDTLPASDKVQIPPGYEKTAIFENKALASKTLAEYAQTDQVVNKTITQRIMSEPDMGNRLTLQNLLLKKK